MAGRIGVLSGGISTDFGLDDKLGTLLGIVLTLLFTWLAVRIVRHFIVGIEKRMDQAGHSGVALVRFGRHVAISLIWLSGGMSALVTVAPQLKSAFSTLLGASGVLAVVAGLASQEALSSMVSGLIILTFKPFVLGDVIRYVDSDISGVVEEISIRHTIIRTWESKRVIVPNSKMNNAIIENADYGDSKLCVFLEIGVTYESDLQAAREIMIREVAAHPSYLDQRTEEEKQAGTPPVLVRVMELAESAVVLRAWVWAKDNATAAAMKSDLLMSVKSAYEKAGIEIAYPHMVIVGKS